MHIDQAIQILSEAKASGTQAIVFSFWEADLFALPNDNAWESLTEIIEDSMDWSRTHDDISTIIQNENKQC